MPHVFQIIINNHPNYHIYNLHMITRCGNIREVKLLIFSYIHLKITQIIWGKFKHFSYNI